MSDVVPIFLSSDDNYAPFVATTIASICDNTTSFVQIYVLDGGITDKNKEKITELKKQFYHFDVEFIEIDIEKEFGHIDFSHAQKYISLSTYSRFLIPNLKPNISKALYSDVDVIFLGNIADMYAENTDSYALAAVPDYYAQSVIFNKYKQAIGLDLKHSYFAAGNLLIDCEKWRKENILERLFEITKNVNENYKHNDQDVLNVAFENNYKQLPYRYCFCVANCVNTPEDTDIVIRHFNSPVKPWHLNPDTQTALMPHLKEFWKYARMTEFYDDLYQKTLDGEQQAQQLRKLRVINLASKVKL